MSKPAIDAVIRKMVTQLFGMMGLPPSQYREAFEALVMKCHACRVLTHAKNGDLGATRDTFTKIEAMEKAIRNTGRDVMIPWPSIGVIMIARLLRVIPGGTKDKLTRRIISYHLYDKAPTAVKAYNESTCTGLFFIKNCPEEISCVGKIPGNPNETSSQGADPVLVEADATEFFTGKTHLIRLVETITYSDDRDPEVAKEMQVKYREKKTITRDEVLTKHNFLPRAGDPDHTDQLGLKAEINLMEEHELKVLPRGIKEKLLDWATYMGAAELRERLTTMVDIDITSCEYEKIKLANVLPHWSCNPMWDLGNHAHALALATENRPEYHRLRILGWRMKVAAAQMSQYIHDMEIKWGGQQRQLEASGELLRETVEEAVTTALEAHDATYNIEPTILNDPSILRDPRTKNGELAAENEKLKSAIAKQFRDAQKSNLEARERAEMMEEQAKTIESMKAEIDDLTKAIAFRREADESTKPPDKKRRRRDGHKGPLRF